MLQVSCLHDQYCIQCPHCLCLSPTKGPRSLNRLSHRNHGRRLDTKATLCRKRISYRFGKRFTDACLVQSNVVRTPRNFAHSIEDWERSQRNIIPRPLCRFPHCEPCQLFSRYKTRGRIFYNLVTEGLRHHDSSNGYPGSQHKSEILEAGRYK